jgi:hypothetical protein
MTLSLSMPPFYGQADIGSTAAKIKRGAALTLGTVPMRGELL